jgi:hypothetical protein
MSIKTSFKYNPVQEPNGNIAQFGLPTNEGNALVTEIVTSSINALDATSKCFTLATDNRYALAGSPGCLEIVRKFFSGDDAIISTIEIIYATSLIESFMGTVGMALPEFSLKIDDSGFIYQDAIDKLSVEFNIIIPSSVGGAFETFVDIDNNLLVSGLSVSAFETDYEQIDLSWNAFPDAVEYTIYRSERKTALHMIDEDDYESDLIPQPTKISIVGSCSDATFLTQVECEEYACSDATFLTQVECETFFCDDGMSEDETACNDAGQVWDVNGTWAPWGTWSPAPTSYIDVPPSNGIYYYWITAKDSVDVESKPYIFNSSTMQSAWGIRTALKSDPDISYATNLDAQTGSLDYIRVLWKGEMTVDPNGPGSGCYDCWNNGVEQPFVTEASCIPRCDDYLGNWTSWDPETDCTGYGYCYVQTRTWIDQWWPWPDYYTDWSTSQIVNAHMTSSQCYALDTDGSGTGEDVTLYTWTNQYSWENAGNTWDQYLKADGSPEWNRRNKCENNDGTWVSNNQTYDPTSFRVYRADINGRNAGDYKFVKEINFGDTDYNYSGDWYNLYDYDPKNFQISYYYKVSQTINGTEGRKTNYNQGFQQSTVGPDYWFLDYWYLGQYDQ